MLHDNRNECFVMIQMDIERFRIINERWGMNEGDRLLRYIGNGLREKLSTCDNVTFARTEADVFFLCVPYTEEKVTKLISYIESVLSGYEIEFKLVPYFGLYIIKNSELPVGQICDCSDLACRMIKGNVNNRIAYYDDAMKKAMLWEKNVTKQMWYALEEEQFEVFLQPLCDVQSGKPVAAEALIRWNHPEKGILTPDLFLKVFERNGFIMRLDIFVWEQVCLLLRRWKREGRELHPITVNISKSNLDNPKLYSILTSLVEEYHISPDLLAIELTESVFAENQNMQIEVMEKLQDYGFRVLMDDFGSGESSVNMLKEADVDMLKLNLKSVLQTGRPEQSGNRLSAVGRMAKWLDLPVIAEGVETKKQADYLSSIGCYVAQGIYYSKPLPIHEYEDYIENMLEEPLLQLV